MSSSSSLSSSSNGCGPFEYDPRGRDGIGVVQAQSGINYPLVLPSDDVRYLLADLQLSFDEPSNYNPAIPDFEPPFFIYWMYGFGCNTTNGPGGAYQPTPSHSHDIVIIDNTGAIVFDSTGIDIGYDERDWGDRLRVVTWRNANDAILSAVYHTHWHPTGTPEPQHYPVYFFPDKAQLDERSVLRLPKRLRSLQVVFDNLRRSGVDFVAGYNMNIVRDDTEEEDGGRRTTRVIFNATPGEGLGIFPGCDPEPLVIRTINGIGPTTHGDFYWSATDCLYVRQPTIIFPGSPSLSVPTINVAPGNVPTAELPAADAGTTKLTLGWPEGDSADYAHLQIGSDCDACCDCEDYIEVAKYLNRTRDQYDDLGLRAEASRDLYNQNRERWLTTALCTAQRPIRIKLLPQICPFLDVAVQFCNQSDKCLINVELCVSFTTATGLGTATIVPGFSFATGITRRPNRYGSGTERYTPAGLYPGPICATFDNVAPFQSVNFRFRLEFDNCGEVNSGEPYIVTGCATGTANGDPITIPECISIIRYPTNPLIDSGDPEAVGNHPSGCDTGPDPAAEACETVALDCPLGGDRTFDPLGCISCEEV